MIVIMKTLEHTCRCPDTNKLKHTQKHTLISNFLHRLVVQIYPNVSSLEFTDVILSRKEDVTQGKISVIAGKIVKRNKTSKQ